jgi:hypothetical protein
MSTFSTPSRPPLPVGISPARGEIDSLDIWRLAANDEAPISPLAEEMSDRTEGGASRQSNREGTTL